MDDPRLIGLRALLSVGRRGVSALAADTTLPPKAAIEEIVEQGRMIAAEIRQQDLLQARPAIEALHNDRAAVAYLRKLAAESETARADPHGPYQADRLWLSTLVGLLFLVSVAALAVALIVHGVAKDRWSAVLAIALGAVIGFGAGDWAGRSHTLRRALPAFAIILFGLAATWAILVLRPHWPTLLVLSVTVIAAVAGAGVLVGRARRKVPAQRESEIARNLPKEIATAEKREETSEKALRTLEGEHSAHLDEVSAHVLVAVEGYIREIDDARIAAGVLGAGGGNAQTLRQHAAQLITLWPRTFV